MKCSMQDRAVRRLAGDAVVQRLKSIVAHSNATTAEMMVYLAEADDRKLYVPAGYPSMFAYCTGELHMSEDQAYKRIQAARAARQFPALFDAVAEGRLHLSAVCMLATHLTPELADGLIEAATHKSKLEIEQVLAERFPAPDVATRLVALSTPQAAPQLAPGQVESLSLTGQVDTTLPAATAPMNPAPASLQHAPGHVGRIAPLAPQRFELRTTIDQEAYDLLRDVQDLLGHEVARGDIAEIFKRSLRVHKTLLEKRKFAACSKPRKSQGPPTTASRHIPAHVKRKVSIRDRQQCTFVSNSGHRCQSRRDLEFDHIEPFARGGKATTSNLRLRCRAHNQYEAERTYGEGFMKSKRNEATVPSHAENMGTHGPPRRL